jgi:hypothetical protein
MTIRRFVARRQLDSVELTWVVRKRVRIRDSGTLVESSHGSRFVVETVA